MRPTALRDFAELNDYFLHNPPEILISVCSFSRIEQFHLSASRLLWTTYPLSPQSLGMMLAPSQKVWKHCLSILQLRALKEWPAALGLIAECSTVKIHQNEAAVV